MANDNNIADLLGIPEAVSRRARTNVLAADSNPDAEAEILKLSRQTGLPLPTVRSQTDEVRKTARVAGIDYEALAKKYPKTAAMLADPVKSRITLDDVENMRALEDEARKREYPDIVAEDREWWRAITDPLQEGYRTTRANFAGAFLNTDDPNARAVAYSNMMRGAEAVGPSVEMMEKVSSISDATSFSNALRAIAQNPEAVGQVVLQSLGAAAPQLVATAAAGPVGALAMAGVSGVGSFATEYAASFMEVIEESAAQRNGPMALADAFNDPVVLAAAREKAYKRGLPIALFDAITAGVSGKLLAGAKPTASSVGTRLAGETAVQAGGGAAGEATAQLATGDYRPGDILLEAIAEMPTALIEAPLSYKRQMAQAMRADQVAQRIQKLDELAKASKVKARDTETFEAFMQSATEDGPITELYLDPQDLDAAGVAESVAGLSPEVASQIEAARATGKPIRISVSEFAAKLSGTPEGDALLDRLRTEADGMSQAQAREFMDTALEELEKEYQAKIQDAEQADDFQASAQEVEDTVAGMLKASNAFADLGKGKRESAIQAQAILWRNAMATLSADFGVAPMDLLRRRMLQVERVAFEDWQARSGDGMLQGLDAGALVPADQADAAPVGAWVQDPGPDINGTPVSQVRELDLADLYLPELDEQGRLGPEKRKDLEPYTARAAAGEVAPNITVVEMEDGRMRVVDGHRRVLAARAAGQTKIRATVSPLVQTPDGPKSATVELLQDNALFQSAFHGTPHKFDRFSLEAIGTGEGAQAFGWGLYFAERRGVAEWYRRELLDRGSPDLSLIRQYYAPGRIIPKFVGQDKVLSFDEKEDGTWTVTVQGVDKNGEPLRGLDGEPRTHSTRPTFKETEKVLGVKAGNLYQVDIPEDSELLEWDKPLKEQPALWDALDRVDSTYRDRENGGFISVGELLRKKEERHFMDPYAPSGGVTGADAVKLLQTEMRGEREASMKLMELGYKGLKYKDQSSRYFEDTGEVTYNYVIWDEDAVTVEAVNDELVQAARQSFYQGGPQMDPLTAELIDLGASVDSQGNVLVYHRTSQEKADQIKADGVMTGLEDGLFFSTRRDGEASGYGEAVVALAIPVDRLQLDDLFEGEAHLRLATRRAGQKVNVRPWLERAAREDFNQFAGRRSAGADFTELQRAQQMYDASPKAPKIMERIRQLTGWFVGADGKWRYEISDDQAAIIPTLREGQTGIFKLGDLLSHDRLYAAYPDLESLTVSLSSDPPYKGAYNLFYDAIDLNSSRSPDDILSTLLHETQHAIQRREGFNRGGSANRDYTDTIKAALSRMQSDAELDLEAWTQGNAKLIDQAKAAGDRVRYGFLYKQFQQLIDYSGRAKPGGVLRHIRNATQWLYSDVMNTTPELKDRARDLGQRWYNLPKRHRTEQRNAFLRDYSFELAQLIRDAVPADVWASFESDERTLNGMLKALEREASKARGATAEGSELRQAADRAGFLGEQYGFAGPYAIYNALAGEVEARNVQARQQMTEAERAETSPAATASVGPGRVIVTMNGREVKGPLPQNAMLYQGRGARAAAPQGAFTPSNNTISLFDDMNMSTFLHESGHYFLELQMELAAELAAVPDADLTPGQKRIQKNTAAIMAWFGLRDVDEWSRLPLEEKRVYHERWAESFERYLFTGQAPSIELSGAFQQFRQWLLGVYTSIKEFLARNPGAGKLNEEVAAVFDRMLASDEQIQAVKEARSMLPLFNQERAQAIGMSPEEFIAYQNAARGADEDARADLQEKVLRDMQWLRNAQARELKRLQRQHKKTRRDVRSQVRTQVMASPVYQAWAFLTGKLSADDRAMAGLPALPKSKPDVLDPTIDSLFAAIAKLGGLDKDTLVSEWGLDPKDKVQSGVFGKPVLRKETGKTPDAMAESLAELGYLPVDEYGKADLHEFEERYREELAGNKQYSNEVDPRISGAYGDPRPGEDAQAFREGVGGASLLASGRIDEGSLVDLYGSDDADEVTALKGYRMTGRDAIHVDIVAELFGFDSGDALVQAINEATPLAEEIEARTDQVMLEEYGEIATPDAMARAADKALANRARQRLVNREANILAKATGAPKIVAQAAKAFASKLIAGTRIRDLRPTEYQAAANRAGVNASRAMDKGDTKTAGAEKRNQAVAMYAEREARAAREEIEKSAKRLRKLAKSGSKTIDPEYMEQIMALLERFDLAKVSNKNLDRRASLADWVESQNRMGIEPDIDPALVNEANRKNYRNMTVEEFRGVVSAVRQLEHLGRLKNRLLTARDKRTFEQVRDLIADSIVTNAGDKRADTRTPTTNLGRRIQGVRNFFASHIKAATLARVMDGGKDGGPLWEYVVRSANEKADWETQMRAKVTQDLAAILAPVQRLGEMGGKGRDFPTIGRSLNREGRLAVALNVGNEGNLQRLLGGEGWTMEQIRPVLESLTRAEWDAVQAIWDYFDREFRPLIGEKEKRVYGVAPNWVEPQAFEVTTANGETIKLRGGYYPIKYDPAASQRAEENADADAAKAELQGAYTAATTRRSFTKARALEVNERPLLYTLDGLFNGANEVIHDLAWHEWLIDTNRLMRSNKIDAAMRQHYGPAAKRQFKTWTEDIAAESRRAHESEAWLSQIRRGVSAAGLGFNVLSALLQPLGFTQSVVRIGPQWAGRGLRMYFGNPVQQGRLIRARSAFMADRTRTRFRELNEIQNAIRDTNKGSAGLRLVQQYSYWLMVHVQLTVDYPTWIGAYEKAISQDPDEVRAVGLADQAVKDSQGSGLLLDLSSIERGGPGQKLFTVFYSYMNTALNLGYAEVQTQKDRGKLAANLLLLYTIPAVLTEALKAGLTPGDDEEWDLDDPAQLARKAAEAQISMLMGLMVGAREVSSAAAVVSGGHVWSYQGPAGVRLIGDLQDAIVQTGQGEFDEAFVKSMINVLSSYHGLPAAQINRTWKGIEALAEGDTQNPGALLTGYDGD